MGVGGVAQGESLADFDLDVSGCVLGEQFAGGFVDFLAGGDVVPEGRGG